MLAACLALPGAASASTITVNNIGDATANDGVCTLREAITSANNNASSGAAAGECGAGQNLITDLIEFQIAGAGPHVIAPASALPAVTQAVTIDGGTDVLPPGPPLDEIRLDGGGTVGPGLTVTADGLTTITDLTVVRMLTAGIDLSGSTGVTVTDSFIGTDPAGTAGLGNTRGVRLGTTAEPTAGASVRSSVISGNSIQGVLVEGQPPSGNNGISGNRIGTTPSGNAALPNLTGVEIVDVDSTRVGGDVPATDGNLISGNTSVGVRIRTSGADRASFSQILSNRIGTTANGETALGNGTGISLEGGVDETLIRDNLVSGNTSANGGILLASGGSQPAGADGPSANDIVGNRIGTDDDGAADLGNGGSGIAMFDSGLGHPLVDNVIGGATGLTPAGDCAGDCNLISGNAGEGVTAADTALSGLQVLGNRIGTDLSGEVDLGNTLAGVSLGGSTAVVGSPAAPNLVSGNNQGGLLLDDVVDATVQSNLIGVAASGGDLGNGSEGIELQGAGNSQNLIGGTGAGEGNTIANSGLAGVSVASGSTENAILGNSILGNLGLGIDLFGAGGVTANDLGDVDSGGNDLQNFPELSAAVAGSSTAVAGTLESEPSTDYRLEFFSNASPDGSGHGEGETLLGSLEVATDESGFGGFAGTVDGTAGVGEAVSATATKLGALGEPLSTSELAANVTEGCDVTGTSGDDPALTGTSADEVICGLGGDDVIDGGGGDDVIAGGGGTDEIDYSTASAEIDVELATGVITGPGAGLDLVAGMEDVRGTDFDDVIVGDDLANLLFAGAGKDTVNGGDGDDELKGSDGGDTLKGGDGADSLKAQDGGDSLRGQSGDDDDLSGGPGKDNLNGGGGASDHCNGGGNDDDTPANGCESTSSIP